MSGIPKIYKGKPLIHAWPYFDRQGQIIGIVGRYQDGSGKKDIVPFFKRSGSGWAAGAPDDPRPLFGLDRLVKQPKDKAVMIPEGEKPAAALQGLGVCAVTSLGGANAASNTDWTPFNGIKTVYIVPDNDKPGEHYAQTVYRALMALESPPTVKIIRLEGLPDGGDIVDWLQNHAPDWDGYAPFPADSTAWAMTELQAKVENAEPVPGDWATIDDGLPSGWPEPIEIKADLKPVAPFPLDALPDAFRAWVADIAHRMQCPPDYVAVAAIIALSAVVGKKGLIKPKSKDDWTVSPNLWGLNIGRPSVMKTPAANEAMKPLNWLEITAKEAFKQALEANEVEQFINKGGRELAEKQAKELIKAKKFDDARRLLVDNPSESDKPTRRRYIINDTTIEKLGELLNENPNGLLLYRDEISGWLKTIDREDRSNDRAFYIEAFNGLGSYTFDRIGRGTIDISSVCLSILGNIQPGVLRPYLNDAKNGTASDDGMIQRFQLMVWPDLGDWRHIDQWPDNSAKDAAADVFTRLNDWEGYMEAARFSEDGQKAFDAWFCRLHEELRADDIHPAIESHLGKYKSMMPSLAVLVHLADDPYHGDTVGIDAVKKAMAWCDYLKTHMLRVYGSALDPVDANAKTILAKIGSGKLPDWFGTGDVKRGGWTGLDTLDAIKAALARLVDYGWLREHRQPGGTLGGRPSVKYAIHPKFQKRAS